VPGRVPRPDLSDTLRAGRPRDQRHSRAEKRRHEDAKLHVGRSLPSRRVRATSLRVLHRRTGLGSPREPRCVAVYRCGESVEGRPHRQAVLRVIGERPDVNKFDGPGNSVHEQCLTPARCALRHRSRAFWRVALCVSLSRR
jgi:hypothetical protein